MELDRKTRALATIMALAILLVVPLPDFEAAFSRISVIMLLWVSCLTWAATCYFRPKVIPYTWGFFVGSSFFQLLVFKNPLSLVLSVIWKLWLNIRVKRIQKILAAPKNLVALVLISLAAQTAEIPDTKKGRTVEGMASCASVDQIPWAFRKGKRQSRFLIRDRMRLTTQPDFSIWEIHQVLDGGGYVAYVFKRIREDGIVEAIVTKETAYNRILQKGTQRRIAEVRSLKTMTDRAILQFVTPDGGGVNFMPSFGGLSRLQINFTDVKSRATPPVMLVGRSCERLEQDPEAEKEDAAERKEMIKK